MVFYWNTATSKWRCEGSPLAPPVYQDLGSSNVSLSNTPATVFNPTLTIGVWMIIATLTVGGETTAGIAFLAWLAGGTATYTTQATSGNPIGAKWRAPTATSNDNSAEIVVQATVTVTAAGTVLIQAAVGTGGSGSPAVVAVDAGVTVSGTTVQVSHIDCQLVG